MADNVVIRAEGLGKKYVIGHAAERERYVALRDVLVRGAHNIWRKTLGVVVRLHTRYSKSCLIVQTLFLIRPRRV